MSIRSIITRLAAMVIAALTLAGCDQRELCYDHSHGVIVEVGFDWTLAPEANPATMVVWAFPDDGRQGLRFEFPTAGRSDGYQIRLTPGTYTLLCYNGETDFNSERGYYLNDLTITTNEYSLLGPLNRTDNAPRPPATEEEPVRSQASHLYCHTHEQTLTVAPQPAHSHITTGASHKVVFTPRRVTAIYNVRIEQIINFTPDLEASAIVTGLAEHHSFAAGTCGGKEVTVPIPLTTCGEGCLKASFVTFGDAAPHNVSHRLRVYTASKYYYDYDITDQIHSAPDPMNVDIVVKGLKLPDPESGMSPGVNEWEDAEEIEIVM